VLTASAAGAISVNADVFVVEHDIDVVGLDQHSDRHRARVNAALRFVAGTRCTRCTPASLKHRPSAMALNRRDNFFDAAFAAGDIEAISTVKPLLRAKFSYIRTARRKQGRLVAAVPRELPRPRSCRVWVLRQEVDLELRFEPFDFRLKAHDLVLAMSRKSLSASSARLSSSLFGRVDTSGRL